MINQLQIDFNELQQIESYCSNCSKQGTTRVLALKIPFFKEVMLLSFECPHCLHKTNELEPMNQLQSSGVRFELKVRAQQDLDRMIVIQQKSSFRIPDIDFEAGKMRSGQVSTIQGLLQEFIEDLTMDQEWRKNEQPEIFEKIE